MTVLRYLTKKLTVWRSNSNSGESYLQSKGICNHQLSDNLSVKKKVNQMKRKIDMNKALKAICMRRQVIGIINLPIDLES